MQFLINIDLDVEDEHLEEACLEYIELNLEEAQVLETFGYNVLRALEDYDKLYDFVSAMPICIDEILGEDNGS